METRRAAILVYRTGNFSCRVAEIYTAGDGDKVSFYWKVSAEEYCSYLWVIIARTTLLADETTKEMKEKDLKMACVAITLRVSDGESACQVRNMKFSCELLERANSHKS